MPIYSGSTKLVLYLVSLLSVLPASAVLLDNPSKLETTTFDYVVVGG
jgi:hypothetical protein